MVESHVCILQEKYDPSSRAKLWTMPQNQLCLCQGVAVPKTSGSRICPERSDTNADEDLWLSYDASLITLLTSRKNWTPAKLDHLLGRLNSCNFCSVLFCVDFVLFLFVCLFFNTIIRFCHFLIILFTFKPENIV